MSWWKAANMTVTANSKFITVLSGDNWELLNPTDGLVVGNNAPVEIKQAYFNGTNTIIELVNPWPNSTSNNLTGVAFPTDADLGEISKALSSYLENFTLATNTDALNGTENTRPMTALRVREAMNNRLGDIGLNFKVAKVGFNSFTTPEALVTLFGERVEYSSAIIQFEAPEMYGFVRGFVQSTDSYNYSFQEFTGASDKKYFRTATNATTWTPWREFLLKGDNGFGTTIAGVQTVTASLTPSQAVANVGDFKHYTGITLNHGSYAPTTFGVISGYAGSDNNYSSTYQEFSTLYGEKYHRTAAGANGWNPWKKVLVEGDFGLGVISSPSGVANNTGLNSIISVGDTWANSPYAGTDGRNQGMILTMKHADPTYGIQMFHGLSTKDLYFRNYSAGSFGSWNKAVFQGDYGLGTNIAGIKDVMAAWNPSTVLANLNSTGSDCHYQGMIQNHESYTPETWGTLSGFVSSGNNYSYTWQEFIGYSSTKWRRNATGSTTWTSWRKVLEAGDFGVGNAIEGVNIRTLPPTSFFTGSTGNQLSGAPDNGYGFGMKVSHPTQGANYYASLYRAHDTERWFVTGTYGQGANPWRELYHTASAVGHVSFADGANTGAIIERGSNSNGNFIAFADGTLVCWIVFSASLGVTQYAPGINATSPGWTFPSGFQGGIPSVSVSGGDSANPGWASASEANATGVTLTYYTRSAAPSLVVMQAVAVGRWR